MHGSRGCFGCCVKPPAVTGVDEPSMVLRVKDQKVRSFSISDNFWTSSASEVDNSASQSQQSMPSISALNQSLDHASISSSNEFVNHGLLLWNQKRQQWIGNKQPENKKQVQEPSINWNATYKSLLEANKPFPRPIPLAEMVDFLVDVWKQEGLYD